MELEGDGLVKGSSIWRKARAWFNISLRDLTTSSNVAAELPAAPMVQMSVRS